MEPTYVQNVEALKATVAEYLPMDLQPLEAVAQRYLDVENLRQFDLHTQNALLALIELHADLLTLQTFFLSRLTAAQREGLEYDDRAKHLIDSLSSLMSISSLKNVRQEQSADSVRKMFMAMSKDFRGILVMMAIRYSDLFELIQYSPDLRRQIARQTLEVFVPIAGRLGIYTLKRRLEDMCFSHLSQHEFELLEEAFSKREELRQETIASLTTDLQSYLKENGVEAEVSGRIKGKYSTFTKLKRKASNHLDSIYDLLALRVVVADEVDCYTVMSYINKRWEPVKGRFKDYIAMPKVNGYRSLHTVVSGMISDADRPVEVQIRTEKMHREAEYGVAAHWWYEEDYIKQRQGHLKDVKETKSYLEKVQWVKNLLYLQDQLKMDASFSSVDLFSDRIFVMTLHGMVVELPKGSTPLDFAYSMSEQLGNHCFMAKVNDKAVPLDYELQSGDRVFVVKKMSVRPNLYWLSIVNTEKARKAIRKYLIEQGTDTLVDQGARQLNQMLRKFGEHSLDLEHSFLEQYKGNLLTNKERKELLIQIAQGEIEPEAVVRSVLSQRQMLKKKRSKKSRKVSDASQVYIAGEKGFKTKLAACCLPSEGEKIVGYVTRGGVISLHLVKCKMLVALDQQRCIDASWTAEDRSSDIVSLEVVLKDQYLLKSMSDVLRKQRVLVSRFHHQGEEEGQHRLTFDLQPPHQQATDEVIRQWQDFDDVVEVKVG